jgi:hypothetical protein
MKFRCRCPIKRGSLFVLAKFWFCFTRTLPCGTPQAGTVLRMGGISPRPGVQHYHVDPGLLRHHHHFFLCCYYDY